MRQAYQVGRAMQELLTVTAKDLAQAQGFGQRPSKLGGARFAQTLVFGFLTHPNASLQDLAQVAAVVAEPVTPQAVDQRFTPEAAAHLQALLEATVQQVIGATEPATLEILRRFTSVSVQDSTVVPLPEGLQECFRGCHGSTDTAGRAAIKFQVRFDLLRGQMEAVRVEQGRDSDYATPLQTEAIRSGSLHLRDLGYFDLDVLAEIDVADAYFLSRLHDQTTVWEEDGQRLDLVKLLRSNRERVVVLSVEMGSQHKLPCRLMAVRVPKAVAERRRRQLHRKALKKGYTPSQDKLALCDWNVYVTNVPEETLSVEEAVALVRMRWQIELLFKQWKSDGWLSRSRSEQPWRILCEVFAKMIAMILQHWILVVTCWRHADRSLRRAAKAVRRFGVMLATSLARLADLARVIALIDLSLQRAGRIDRRKAHPNAYQVLENPKKYGYRCYV